MWELVGDHSTVKLFEEVEVHMEGRKWQGSALLDSHRIHLHSLTTKVRLLNPMRRAQRNKGERSLPHPLMERHTAVELWQGQGTRALGISCCFTDC